MRICHEIFAIGQRLAWRKVQLHVLCKQMFVEFLLMRADLDMTYFNAVA